MSNLDFVPILYRRTGIVAFSALSAKRRFNNLRVFNTHGRTDSVPGHHLYQFTFNNFLAICANFTKIAQVTPGTVH